MTPPPKQIDFNDDESPHRVVINARLDIRQLAALALYLNKFEAPPRNRSHLVHSIVHTFHDLLVRAGHLDPIDTATEALEVLGKFGISWTPDTPGHRAIVKSLRDDDAIAEILGSPEARSEAEQAEIAAQIEQMFGGNDG